MSKVWLQGIGEVKSIEAKELAAGMAIMWNYGITSEVVSVEPSKSGKTRMARYAPAASAPAAWWRWPREARGPRARPGPLGHQRASERSGWAHASMGLDGASRSRQGASLLGMVARLQCSGISA